MGLAQAGIRALLVAGIVTNGFPINRCHQRVVTIMVRFELVASELAALPPLPLLPEKYQVGGSQPQVQLPLLSLLAVGRGYGHGVGMSQWGALGLAQRGESYDQILCHYYRGTELRPYASP